MPMFMIILGTFLVNSLPALVLFETGVSWSFVVNTWDGKEVSVSDVHVVS